MMQLNNPSVAKRANMSLRIYYDGQCPLCNAEIEQLKALNVDGRLEFADLNDDDLMGEYPHIDRHQARRILHGETADGSLITGLDVTCMAWQSVGRHRWLAILRWPVIRHIADLAYLFFARHRQKISALLMGQHAGTSCRQCR